MIFVGAANQGSDLARRENLDRLLMIFTAYLGSSDNPFVHDVLDKLSGLLAAVRKVLAQTATDLPGVAALAPESELIHTLNESDVPLAGTPSFIRANFGNTTEPLLKLLEPISDQGFGNVLNDLVVPWRGVDNLGKRTASGRPRLNFGSDTAPQGHWYHLNYFDSPDVRKFVAQRLGIA